MSLEVLGVRVMIRPDKVERETASGIIIQSDENLEKYNKPTGTIVSIGKQAWTDVADGTPWAKVGDHVVFAKYAGTWVVDPDTQDPLTGKGEEYVLVNDQDVLCKIEEKTV